MSKRVLIKQMTLLNFKGIKSLTLDFGQVTEIRGANATGKSTIADAFNWVLFGKDSAGNSDSKFGIKTVDAAGKVIEKIDHEVTAILDIDGETVELRRVLSEDWVTPRGQSEAILKGNTTSYFYNGVPLKESEYKIKINSIIDEDLFKMLTNPLYFPRLDWQVQRDMLLKIAGGITLEEIAANRSDFSALLLQLSGKSLAEFKAEISARKKKIKDALDLIPARIDEVMRATPTAPDYKALEDEKTAIEKSIETIETAMKNAAELARAEYEAQAEIQRQINAQKGIQQQAIFDAKQAARESVNNTNIKYNELIHSKNIIEVQNSNFESEIENQKAGMRQNLLKIGEYNRLLESKRNEWIGKNEQEYNSDDNCPTCGQLLPEERRSEKQELFNKSKNETLENINSEGKELKRLKEDLEESNKAIQVNIDENKSKIDLNKKQLDALELQIKATPNTTYCEPQPENIPEYVAAQKEIEALNDKLKNRPETETQTSDLTQKKQDLNRQLDEVKKQLNVKTVIETNEKRKAELLKEERELAQQKADLEKQEFTADSLVKEQMNEVERRVNLKFKLVRFKMYSPQINGGEKPDCILIGIDGAKFMDTNSAGKIAIGLDIINTLCEFNGVYAPIFVDNAEGINQILPVNSQLIKLIVTHDKELKVC